jgi:hypothetical protein
MTAFVTLNKVKSLNTKHIKYVTEFMNQSTKGGQRGVMQRGGVKSLPTEMPKESN